MLETSTAVYSSPTDVANLIGETFASVSSSDSYSATFLATKNRSERTPINFRCQQFLPYNCDFYMWELKRALSSAYNSSPRPDGISVVSAKDDAPSTISSRWKAKLETHSSGGTILSLFSLTSRRHMIVLGAMGFLALYRDTG
ncbi:putative RNA-directed DNA polymerase from transposon X-element [Trichonephila clavipes]|nr:putative RNA-directed DNA polymerase from transposon X-element [Trichonephila clavipes]